MSSVRIIDMFVGDIIAFIVIVHMVFFSLWFFHCRSNDWCGGCRDWYW